VWVGVGVTVCVGVGEISNSVQKIYSTQDPLHSEYTYPFGQVYPDDKYVPPVVCIIGDSVCPLDVNITFN